MCPFFEGTKHPKTQTAEGISPTAVFFLVYKFNYELLLLPMLCHIADDMVLKDSGGLVKLYAAVNVEQYNLVTTAATQGECILKYKTLLGISESEELMLETQNVTITISSVKYIDIDGNSYIYLIDTENNIFKAKAAEHENMLLLEAGDTVEILCSGSRIVSCKQTNEALLPYMLKPYLMLFQLLSQSFYFQDK